MSNRSGLLARIGWRKVVHALVGDLRIEAPARRKLQPNAGLEHLHIHLGQAAVEVAKSTPRKRDTRLDKGQRDICTRYGLHLGDGT